MTSSHWTRSLTLALGFLAAASFLTACGNRQPAPDAKAAPPQTASPPAAGSAGAAAPTPADAPSEPGSARIKVMTLDNHPVVTFRPQRDKVAIEYPEGGKDVHLEGKLDGKVRRYTKDGAPYVTAKTVGSTTTIENAAGQTLWVVKLAGKRVRIAKAEGEPKPYVVAKPDSQRLRVILGDEEIGRVTYDEAHSRAKVREKGGKVLYDSVAPRLTSMYGVMLIPNLAADERAVIMGEMLLLGY